MRHYWSSPKRRPTESLRRTQNYGAIKEKVECYIDVKILSSRIKFNYNTDKLPDRILNTIPGPIIERYEENKSVPLRCGNIQVNVSIN